MAGKYQQNTSRETNLPSSTAAGYSNNHFECNPYGKSDDYIVSKPKKPTPLNLYLGSRMEELTALGKTKDEAFKICTLQYKAMPEEEKVLWILQALKKEPEYTAQCEKYLKRFPNVFLPNPMLFLPAEKEIISRHFATTAGIMPHQITGLTDKLLKRDEREPEKTEFIEVITKPRMKEHGYVDPSQKPKRQQNASNLVPINLECFEVSDSDSDLKSKAKAKLPRKPTPYSLYHDSRLKSLLALGKSRDETFKICTEDYQKMPDGLKLHWILLADEKTPAYLLELERFRKDNPTHHMQGKVYSIVLGKNEQRIKNRLGTTQRPDSRSQSTPEPPKPQQVPSFGFNLFCRQLLSSDMFRALKGKDRDQQLSLRWKKLTEKERSEFDVEAEKMRVNYPMEYAVYLEILPLEKQPQQGPDDIALTTGGVKRSNPDKVQNNVEALHWTKRVRIEQNSSYLF